MWETERETASRIVKGGGRGKKREEEKVRESEVRKETAVGRGGEGKEEERRKGRYRERKTEFLSGAYYHGFVI